MKFVSIKSKLITFVTRVILLIIGLLVVLESVFSIFNSNARYKYVKTSTMKSLISNGKTLVTNNSRALRNLAADNANLAINEIVRSTVSENNDIAYGIYMDDKRRTLEFDWEGRITGKRTLNDSVSIWAGKLDKPSYKEIQTDTVGMIEFAAPIVCDTKRLGCIRYGITTAALNEVIAVGKRDMIKNIILAPAVIFISGILTLFIFLRATQLQAQALTQPLDELNKAANTIAKGDYTVHAIAKTNDEIGALAQSFEIMRLKVKHYTNNLEQMVEKRTEQLKAAQKEVIEKAHRAGMADAVINTIHNVGNILNSVKTSINVIETSLEDSPVYATLNQTNELIKSNLDPLEDCICTHTKGVIKMGYYFTIEDALIKMRDRLKYHTNRLKEKVTIIENVIAEQQNYAGAGHLVEEVELKSVVEKAIEMESGLIARHQITVIRDYQDVPEVPMQRSKLIHILVNLLKNAIEANLKTDHDNRRVVLSLYKENKNIILKLSDTGCGIEKQFLKKVFAPGFSTKTSGHGFGLHSCANYAKEMGAEIRAESDGPGKGAAFIFEYPLDS